MIEMQSAATPGTLIRNAVSAGYAPDEIDEFEPTPEQYSALRAANVASLERDPTLEDVLAVLNQDAGFREKLAAVIAQKQK
jgi:hypothetical protein